MYKGSVPSLSYVANYHLLGAAYVKKIATVSDPSHTMVLLDGNGFATISRNNAIDGGGDYRFSPRHNRTGNILYLDGHVGGKVKVFADDLGQW
jgi:prepilin-type processing-associated H-X9-DG protein